MSLLDPSNSKERYVQFLRYHMEKLFGADLKSMYLNNVLFKDPDSEKTFKIDIFRFQQHFPIKLPMAFVPFLDLFIDPISNNPKINLCTKNNVVTTNINEPIPPDQLESLFASLIWGAKITKTGVQVQQKSIVVQ